MKTVTKLMTLLFALATPLAFAADAPADAAKEPAFKTHILSRAEFDALIAKPEKVVIIDVRRPDELTEKGGFPVYLSIQAKELPNSLAFIPRDRAIITVSNHAARAGKAADFLTEHGFKVAGTIGVEGYAAEGGTLTKIAPPPAKTADAAAATATGEH